MQASLPKAVATLEHRGPDDSGMWIGENVGLGHTRLSILDLSPGGHQPMLTPDGRFAMVFNGEVYNFRALRTELEAAGYSFHSSSDTEVVLAAFAHWGIDAVQRFIGMFAIALWDTQEKVITLIRDRLGVKPLYYGWDGQTLWFGSELKALRAFPHWQHELDHAAMGDFFRFGYINAPRSIYRAVHKVSPGCSVRLGVTGEPKERRYWSVLDVLGQPLEGSEDDLADQLEALLADAFGLRLVSDVPVGVFLSGGIDSSLLAALLQKQAATPINTFTIGFNADYVNEAGYAKRVADYLGTRHTECILDVGEAMRILPGWAKLYDEPFADQSGIPTYLVSKIAADQVKVVLSADGGDELFSGYNIYTSVIRHWGKRGRIPRLLRDAICLGLSATPMESLGNLLDVTPMPMALRRQLKLNTVWKARSIDNYLSADTAGMLYERSLSHWNPGELNGLLGGYEPFRESADAYPGALEETLCLWDLHNYLPGDILAKVDRATMAASIEGREPLIDHRVVEFAFRLPLHLRRGPLGPKHILKKVLYRHVPRELVDRPKQGFGIPLLEWLRGDLGYLVDEYLNLDRIREANILDGNTVHRTVRALRQGDDRAVNKVWTLLAFQMWHEQWQ